MDNVGDNISAKSANWTFGGDVHLYFDDHVNKSVPLYGIGHDLIEKLSEINATFLVSTHPWLLNKKSRKTQGF